METPRRSADRDEMNAPNPLIARIQGEYSEMPGLRLNLAQACRLWQVDVTMCKLLLEQLVRDKILFRTHDGFYVALAASRRPVKAPFVGHARVPRSA
jgi:hypothetical protein